MKAVSIDPPLFGGLERELLFGAGVAVALTCVVCYLLPALWRLMWRPPKLVIPPPQPPPPAPPELGPYR